MTDAVHQSGFSTPRATTISGKRKKFTLREIPANSGSFFELGD
jgi:hypothetical protein